MMLRTVASCLCPLGISFLIGLVAICHELSSAYSELNTSSLTVQRPLVFTITLPDNEKVHDSLTVSNPPFYNLLFQALGGVFRYRKFFAFGLFTIGCPRVPGQSINGSDVVNYLETAVQRERAVPERIQVDNGSEFISKELDRWAY